MSSTLVIAVIVVLFAVLLLAGGYIHTVLLVAGIGGVLLLSGTDILGGLLGPLPFSRTASYTLTTIPLFVLMAQFVLQADIVKDLFYVVNRVSKNRNGVLGSLTLVAGAMLGAVSGSGVAAAASLGQVAVPELEKSGFKRAHAGAVAAAAGSLSGIVPPSIILILFGVATETPIGDLFIGAVIPAAAVTLVFILVMMFYLRRDHAKAELANWPAAPVESIGVPRLIVSMSVMGVIVFVVLGGIYAGMVTATEAGAIGAFSALLAAIVLGQFSLRFLRDSFLETVKITSMVMLILIGAQIFGKFVTLSLLPRRLIDLLGPLVDNPVAMIAILSAVFFILFMFIEGAAVILMTIPVILPIINAMNMDLLWFGVFVAMICTVGLITPPVGLSVYAVSGASGVSSGGIFKYATGFAVLAVLIVAAMMTIFPQMATWLPSVAA
ncbi:TRAP transporter large permease subunit [Janibacter cremeus]|uniref:TRAP transporter large permease n=1 Tax=Janibacter cremeus TaxID=1285192 RepID=UPI0023FA2EA0|nr:TRAP transporter large permease subunit [Janibacter cremeus]WEV78735.1 TRAP transporter large permease subunit [Janibacter cremeus]